MEIDDHEGVVHIFMNGDARMLMLAEKPRMCGMYRFRRIVQSGVT